jgi:hypothetical protein
VLAGNFSAVAISDHQIVGIHHAFAESAGSGENAFGIEANSDIAVARGDKSPFVEPVSGSTNVQAMFSLRLLMAGRNVIGTHINF